MYRDPLKEIIDKQGYVLLDGGLATELEARGGDLNDRLWSAKMLMDNPELIRDVHLDYYRSGADIVVSASYQATIEGFMQKGLSREQSKGLLVKSVELVKEAREIYLNSLSSVTGKLIPLVAASIGPYGAYLADGSEYSGNYGLTLNELMMFHRPRLEVLWKASPDLVVFETIPCKLEVQAIVQLLQEYPDIPALVSLSTGDGINTYDGLSITDSFTRIETCSNILAAGVNCTSPENISIFLQTIKKTQKPLSVCPNSGEVWDAAGKCWTGIVTGNKFTDYAREWHHSGARIIGGCCRTTPADIREIKKALECKGSNT